MTDPRAIKISLKGYVAALRIQITSWEKKWGTPSIIDLICPRLL